MLVLTRKRNQSIIVNDNIESTVDRIQAIIKKPNPYTEIKNLPELLDKFMFDYSDLISDMEEPILSVIEEAKKRVFDELSGKLCEDSLKGKYNERFAEIREKATHCNNVATLQNIKLEADTLKVRFLNEIAAEEARLIEKLAAERIQNEEDKTQTEGVKENSPSEYVEKPIKIKKQKVVSIKTINSEATWQIESADDVKKYIAELEKKLMAQLEDDTVIHVEF